MRKSNDLLINFNLEDSRPSENVKNLIEDIRIPFLTSKIHFAVVIVCNDGFKILGYPIQKIEGEPFTVAKMNVAHSLSEFEKSHSDMTAIFFKAYQTAYNKK